MALLHNLSQSSRVIQNRAWTEHIVVPRLIIMISHEQRRLVSLKQALFPDIGIRVVDERAFLQ